MASIIGLDIVPNFPAPGSHTPPTEHDRLTQVVENAQLFEELGFDGYSVGERHHAPFLSSAPPVVLSHIAARTTSLRLFTGVTLLSVLDPVRVAEDYATLDHLAGGRLELIVGKGNGPEQSELFGISREHAWATQRENYELLRALWSDEPVTWEPDPNAPSIRRTPLRGAVTYPRPFQRRIPTWHGSSTSTKTVELAARHGDPIWVANRQKTVEGYRPLVEHYRRAWAAAGRDPADARVGAGFSVLLTETQEEAEEIFRPIYEEHFAGQVDTFNNFDPDTLFHSFEDYIERSSFLIGTPEKALQKLRRYHDAYGFNAISIDGHQGHYPRDTWLRSLELFRDEVAPELERFAPAGR
ncbi:MAG: LLM class flavin-dependent oxidoreductase [Galactobacter sp.]